MCSRRSRISESKLKISANKALNPDWDTVIMGPTMHVDFSSIDLVALFFVLGVVASWAKSDLHIPAEISQFLSIYLLVCIGLKGGQQVLIAESFHGFLPVIAIGIGSSLLIPLALFFGFKKTLGPANAAALGACYGSVSAMTFIATLGFLDNQGVPHSGYMVAVLALMEIPAIVISLLLYGHVSVAGGLNRAEVLRVLRTKSVLLLIGGFLIGLCLNASTWSSVKIVVSDSFKGVLAFYLIDLGIHSHKQLRHALPYRAVFFTLGIVAPLVCGTLTMCLAQWIGVSDGDSVLLAALVGSASYIAAPATFRMAVPEANPALYVSLPIAATFPMNLILGIPLYESLARSL